MPGDEGGATAELSALADGLGAVRSVPQGGHHPAHRACAERGASHGRPDAAAERPAPAVRGGLACHGGRQARPRGARRPMPPRSRRRPRRPTSAAARARVAPGRGLRRRRRGPCRASRARGGWSRRTGAPRWTPRPSRSAPRAARRSRRPGSRRASPSRGTRHRDRRCAGRCWPSRRTRPSGSRRCGISSKGRSPVPAAVPCRRRDHAGSRAATWKGPDELPADVAVAIGIGDVELRPRPRGERAPEGFEVARPHDVEEAANRRGLEPRRRQGERRAGGVEERRHDGTARCHDDLEGLRLAATHGDLLA